MNNHPYFPPHHLEDVVKKFNAIDRSIMLHYSTHTADGVLAKILDQASHLAQMRIKFSDFEYLMGFDSSLYVVYKLGSGYYDYSNIYVRFPDSLKQTLVQNRQDRFRTVLNKWLAENQNWRCFPHLTVQDAIKKGEKEKEKEKEKDKEKDKEMDKEKNKDENRGRICKTSPKKRALDLKNDNTKFRFNQLDAAVQSQKSGGLSLLERIRLKEQLSKETVVESPQEKREKLLLGKAPLVYDILSHTNDKSIHLPKLIQIIQDSLSYPLDKEEIESVLRMIAERVEGVSMVKRGDVEVVRVGGFNREGDLRALQIPDEPER